MISVLFANRELEKLYVMPGYYPKGYPRGVMENFIDVVAFLENMRDTRDLYAMKGFNFEKLHGGLQGFYSIRLNRQYRVILSMRDRDGTTVITIKEISNHYN